MRFVKTSLIAVILLATTATVAASPAEMTVFPEESSTRIDSFTSYELNIENVGPVEDTYTFTSSSAQEIDIAPRKITLEAGEEETVNVWYNPSPDREEGTYSFSVTAESRATGDSFSSEIIASVIREHDVKVQAQKTSQTVCRGEKATYEVEVTNNGIQKEEFQLSTDYGTLSQNKVTLEDGETKTVTLTASSDSEATENFNIRAASTTSYAQDIQNVQFNAETCYASDISTTSTQEEVAGGTTTEIEVAVQNKGTKKDTFTLVADKGSFSENPVEVPGGETETVTFEVTPEKLGEQTVTISSKGRSNSTTQVTLNVYNGNDMEVSFNQEQVSVCETEKANITTNIENTGETDETFNLETSRGELTRQQLEIEAGETASAVTSVDARKLEPGKTYDVRTTATAASYGEPQKSSTAQMTVNNCYDLSMNVVPEVASAGENRSVIYKINLENTGTKQNTYELAYEGPEWISIKPREVTVQPGKTGTSYMYAGIPFKKEGNVQITATAVGTNTTDSQTVELVIGKKIEEAIKDGSNKFGGGVLNQITQSLADLQSSGTAAKTAIAVILAAVTTAVILLRS
ncbi:MAG: hypothetical protein ABEJ95_06230 [Candidatus Nanohalobium sp.]